MNNPEDTATIERDLRAVDAALGNGAATHDDPSARELQELALALRADSPVPRGAFAEELGRRVEAGFAPEPGSGPSRLALPRARLLRVAGVAAPLLLIVVVVFAAGGALERGGDGDDAADGGGGGSVASEAAPGSDAGESGGGGRAEGALAQPPLPGTAFAPRHRERRIERSISMTLTAPDEEIPALAEDVNGVAARYGGFVLRSELDTGDGGATGSYELRIPSSRLQGAVRALAGLATVSSQSQSGQDVTRDFVTTADRLEAARAERRSLLRRLEDAKTDSEAEALRDRLDVVAGEINGLRAQMRDLRLRTDYAIVSVDLIGDESDSGSSGGGGGSFDDAVGDAGELLVGFAGVLIRVLAIAVPIGLIAGLVWVGMAAVRRRRRESALA
jgi:Domain of unknown function (DUF4349)